MYDFLICKKKLPVPENFLNLDWANEPFRTSSLGKNFQNYIISKHGNLLRQKDEKLEKINYHGFIYFSTHFFDEPQTKQYYISFFSSFNEGVLEELSLEGFKEYSLDNLKSEKIKLTLHKRHSLFFRTINLIKKYLKF